MFPMILTTFPPLPSEYASKPSLDSDSNNSNDTDHMLQKYMDGENVEEEDDLARCIMPMMRHCKMPR